VADPSVDYASGKLAIEDGVRRLQPDPYPLGLNARLRSVLQRYRSAPLLFEAIRNRWHGSTPSQPNRMHLGPVGAADQVIDDPSRILEIQLNWRKLIGVEMETYGVYRAVHESPEPKPRAVSFKAVCDFAAEKERQLARLCRLCCCRVRRRIYKAGVGEFMAEDTIKTRGGINVICRSSGRSGKLQQLELSTRDFKTLIRMPRSASLILLSQS